MNFKLKPVLAAAALAVGMSAAHAAPTTALYLTMDGSGSINAANFTLQINGYISALNNLFAGAPSLYGTVAIGGGIFGANFSQFFGVTAIDSAVELGLLTAAISALDPGRGGISTGATAIGDAITASANALTAYESALGSDINLLIDVTTDGAHNFGAAPGPVANALVPSPLDAVNCLGIGGGADCSWVGAAGTNFGNATDFAAFASALETKLKTELKVPEPGTLALVGLAIAGLGFGARRKAA